jgi:hypothetical protein
MPASVNIPASMASGVTKSGFATSLAPKVVGDVAASGASSLGLGALLGALGPAYTIYSVLDALGFFKKRLKATPMTPEQAAKYEATSRLALSQYGKEGGEGAYETVIDAVEQAAQTGLLSNEDIGVAGKWYDPETGEELPDFDPKTGKGMGTLFPMFQPDLVSTAGGGGGGGDTAASAASSEAASAASSQADSAGIGDWVYDADAGVFRQSGGIETFTPVPGTYTDGQTISNADAEAVFGEWGNISEKNTATTPTDTTTTTANSGAINTGLGLPTVLYLPDFGGADGTGTLTLPTFTAGAGTTGTGTTGTGTTGTGTTGTGTTGTGTTGTGAANLGGTGGGLSTGTGTGDGSGTGSGTGTGDGAGDGSGTGDGVGDGTGDGTGREQSEAQELADLLGGGGMRGVATEQAGVADITLMYDPSLSFAENMERMLGKKKNKQADAVDSALMYGGGIVQPTDLNDELLRIIGGR